MKESDVTHDGAIMYNEATTARRVTDSQTFSGPAESNMRTRSGERETSACNLRETEIEDQGLSNGQLQHNISKSEYICTVDWEYIRVCVCIETWKISAG